MFECLNWPILMFTYTYSGLDLILGFSSDLLLGGGGGVGGGGGGGGDV